MAHSQRFTGRHPLCSCPETAFSTMNVPIDRSGCVGGVIAHPAPMTAEHMAELSAEFHRRMAHPDVALPYRPRPLIVNRAGVRRPMPRAVVPESRADVPAATGQESWYRIRNAARGGTAEVYIYDEIGYWGVSAQRFIDELRELDADTIDLHLNSPGGEVYDGIAIYNALLNHPAQVNVTVDALAASAASFIAQAGHTVTMARNAEMMIHDAIGIAWDNAAGLRELADRLDTVSDNIAQIYADRAGGTTSRWRTAMRAETWYSAQEAVDAGLADSVIAVARRGADGEPDNRWSSRRDAVSARFRYVNRGATTAPDVMPDPRTGVVGPVPPDLAPVARWSLDLAADLAPAVPAVSWNVTPDVFHAAVDMVANDAPVPPDLPRPTGAGALTRTVDDGSAGVNLFDLMGEVAAG